MSEEQERRIYDRCVVRVGQLEAENEELRELLKDTWRFVFGSTIGENSASEWHEKALSIHDRMLALGIEVD